MDWRISAGLLALGCHAHDILGNIDADAAAGSMLFKSNGCPVAPASSNKAAEIAGVAHTATTTVARYSLQVVRMSDRKAVCLAYAWRGRRQELGQNTVWRQFDLGGCTTGCKQQE